MFPAVAFLERDFGDVATIRKFKVSEIAENTREVRKKKQKNCEELGNQKN